MSPEADDVEAYGRSLIVNVRDRAISAALLTLEPHAVGPDAEHWRSVVDGGSDVRDTVRALIPEIVDEALFQLLNALDNEELPACVPREGLGELAGWYTGSGMWRSRFSAHPVFDPLEDVI